MTRGSKESNIDFSCVAETQVKVNWETTTVLIQLRFGQVLSIQMVNLDLYQLKIKLIQLLFNYFGDLNIIHKNRQNSLKIPRYPSPNFKHF